MKLIGLIVQHLNCMAAVKRLPDVPLKGVTMLEAAVRGSIKQRAANLPAATVVLPQLQRILQYRNTALDDVCELLKRDMSLIARILQLSNRPYFAPGMPIDSL